MAQPAAARDPVLAQQHALIQAQTTYQQDLLVAQLNTQNGIIQSTLKDQDTHLVAQLSTQNGIIQEAFNAQNTVFAVAMKKLNEASHESFTNLQGDLQGHLVNQEAKFKTMLVEANERDWSDWAITGGVMVLTAAVTVGGIVLFTGE